MDSNLIFGLKIFEREDTNYFLLKISFSTLKSLSFHDCGVPGRVRKQSSPKATCISTDSIKTSD